MPSKPTPPPAPVDPELAELEALMDARERGRQPPVHTDRDREGLLEELENGSAEIDEIETKYRRKGLIP